MRSGKKERKEDEVRREKVAEAFVCQTRRKAKLRMVMNGQMNGMYQGNKLRKVLAKKKDIVGKVQRWRGKLVTRK